MLRHQGEHAESELHTLPDGQSIAVRGEGVQLGEAVLRGKVEADDGPTLVEAVVNSCTCHSEPASRKVSCFAA